MLAVHMPHMAKTLGCGYTTKTLGRANNNKRRREEDAAVHIVESKRQKVMPKSLVKTITSDQAELCAIKTPSNPSKTSLTLAITTAQQLLLKKKREAARASLLAMEKEVDFEDNFETFKQLRMLCGGREVVMGSFNLQRFGVELVLKKEEEEEQDCSGLYQIKTPTNPSKPSLKPEITTTQQLLLKKKREAEREAARASLLAMEKEVDVDDNFKTFKELWMLCGGRQVAMRSFKWQRFEEEEDEDY